MGKLGAGFIGPLVYVAGLATGTAAVLATLLRKPFDVEALLAEVRRWPPAQAAGDAGGQTADTP